MMAETAPMLRPQMSFVRNASSGRLDPLMTVEQVKNNSPESLVVTGPKDEAYLAHADISHRGASFRSASASWGPRIIVPQRAVNLGFDEKFETDHYNMKLFNILTPFQYTDAITKINEAIKPARANGVDTALLVTGPLVVPLGVWGIRHSLQLKKRKKCLYRAIASFNEQYPLVYMRWNRQPSSCLSIERRVESMHGPPPAIPPSANANTEAFEA
jgi:hypothetical protein